MNPMRNEFSRLKTNTRKTKKLPFLYTLGTCASDHSASKNKNLLKNLDNSVHIQRSGRAGFIDLRQEKSKKKTTLDTFCTPAAQTESVSVCQGAWPRILSKFFKTLYTRYPIACPLFQSFR